MLDVERRHDRASILTLLEKQRAFGNIHFKPKKFIPFDPVIPW